MLIRKETFNFSEKEKTFTDWQTYGSCLPTGYKNADEKCTGQIWRQRMCSDGTIDKCSINYMIDRNQTCVPEVCPACKLKYSNQENKRMNISYC